MGIRYDDPMYESPVEDSAYSQDMDWRDYGTDIQQRTRSTLRPDDGNERELPLEQGLTCRRRIG